MEDASPWIIETTPETFQQDVIERSHELPVLVDFWATWCGPCQELGPTLEKLAREGNGAFLLVKVDVDRQPELAAAFRVQSIPHVYALRNGQAVNQFLGNLPEDQLRVWIEQLQPSPYETLVREADGLAASDPDAAAQKYEAAIQANSDEGTARIGLARIRLQQGRDDECREQIATLEARGYLEPEAAEIKAELELRAVARESGGIAECRSAVAADPSNLQLRLQLADALAAEHQFEEALEICLQLVQTERATMGEPAREAMVKMFTILGPESELAQQYRRRLSTALY